MQRTIKTFIDNSGLLILGTAIGLVWANLDRNGYGAVSHRLHFIVNDVAMAFFFALAAKEVTEATAPGGALHSPRRATMPLAAAVGGMLGPALIFLALTIEYDRPDLERGWAIPTATDIAFSYLAARVVFGAKHPAIPFLLLLAIADDALGLLIIAAFYPTGQVRLVEFSIFLAAGMFLAWWMGRQRTKSFWPYVLGAGVLSWIGFYRGGLHSALALVPIIPFLPHAARDPGLFVEAPDAHDTLSEFERWFKRPVDVMLFFFGLANAGVDPRQGRRRHLVRARRHHCRQANRDRRQPPLLSRLGGLHLPRGVSWRDIAVVGIIAGIGFTVALFFATAAFPYGRLLNETKLGALLSFAAAALGLIAAKVLRVGPVQLTSVICGQLDAGAL